MFTWLEEFAKSEWDWRDHHQVGRVSFWFDDAKEATLFKLTWAGAE